MSVTTTRSADRASLRSALILSLCLPGDVLLYLLMPMQPQAFGISLGEAGILLAANRLVRIFSYRYVMKGYARWGDRPSSMLAAGCAALCALGYATLSGFWALLLLRLLWGLSYAALNLSTQIMATTEAAASARRSKLLSALIVQDITLVIRPHPQSLMSEPELIQQLQAQFPNGPRLDWDFSATPFTAMARNDVMVSDISGVIFDYAFLFEKPVITVGIEPVREGTEAIDLPYDPWELTVLNDIGLRLSEQEIPRLTEYLPQVLEDSCYKRNIRRLREQYVVNFGHPAGPILQAIEPLIGQGVDVPSANALSRQVE